MTPSNNSGRRWRSLTSGATLTGVVFVAAAVMITPVLVIHGSHHFPALYESSSDFLPTFVQQSRQSKQPLNQTTTLAKTDATNKTCVSLNSQSWLDGPRIGNALLESEKAAVDLILSTEIPSILEQTICDRKSLFVDWNHVPSDNEEGLNLTSLRLIYLAFHIHQHEPAWNEVRHRQAHCTRNDLSIYQIGNMDYECPDAKFLVVPLGEAGLGAIMRLTVVNALLAGMATGRIIMFINNATLGPPNVQTPWPHASCERHDLQCFFMPSTPCVLTQQELENAHVLTRSEMRSMFRSGEIAGQHANDRVVVTKIHTRPHMVPPNVRDNLVATVKKHMIGFNQDNTALLERAAQLIYDIEPLEESRYYYFAHSSKVHHGAVFYAIRPRPGYASLLNKIVDDSLPVDFDPQISLGLPIRGSDKCLVESECLSFDQYMKVIEAVWNKHGVHDHAVVANVILTTEDEQVIKDMTKFDAKLSFPYRFITNKKDVLQGTGVANDFEKSNNITADQVMLSSVAALKLQLSAKYSVGNCCSNFHNLLFDFMRHECGAARNSVVECLQEMEQAEFRVCCSWDKSDECTAKRLTAKNITNAAKL